MPDPAYFRSLADQVLAGRTWLLCVDAARAALPMSETLHTLGAPRPLILAGTEGTGDPIDPALADVVVLGTHGDTVMDGLRSYARALRDLPAWAARRIEAWDPRGEATVMGTAMDTSVEILGRRPYGMRPQAWADLEDKTTVHGIWEEAGIDTAPQEVVPADRRLLERVAARLDAGGGTVWVGDNREGWHGGAEYLRVVRDSSQAAEAIAFFSAHCDGVRVMPWLEGIPCSIHGMVFPEFSAAFRPTEMLVFRSPGSGRLRYGGLASWWEPAPADRESMREAARRVGKVLRRRVGYRGAFGIDGVMTTEGFRPTELNPRLSPGLGVQAQSPEGSLPLSTLHRALVEGERLDYRAADLEETVLANADAYPQMRLMLAVSRRADDTTAVPVVVSGDGGLQPSEGSEAHGALSFGPSTLGGLVMLRIDPGHARRGRSAAPTASSAGRLADRLWGTGIGPLIEASDVR